MAPEMRPEDLAGAMPATFRSPDELVAVLREYMQVTERLQHTHEALQTEVVRLRQELASKDRELERRRRLAALGELAAGVAHEVRNPLGAIQLYSGLLRNTCQTLTPAIDLITKIEAGVQAIDAVVKDTLALAPRDGQVHQACPLREVVQAASELCLKPFERAGAKLAIDCDTDAAVIANGNGLQRVVVNLLANAAEVSPNGATVRATIRDVEPGQVELRVSDAGPGVPDELIDRIFDPFFTTKETGTGLGLTIAHRLVEAHGGQIHAENRAEGGAVFIVTLPTVAADPQKAAALSKRKNRKTHAA